MPVINRRRRVQTDGEEVPEPEPQPTQSQRLQATQYSDDEEPDSYMEGDEDETQGENSNIVPLARKLVRYALSCEYSRTQIRRTDIAVKGRQPSNLKYAEALTNLCSLGNRKPQIQAGLR